MSGNGSKTERHLGESEGGVKGVSSRISIYGAVNLVHFFMPLPEPIKVPHLTQLPLAYVWNPALDNEPCFRLPSKGNVGYAAREIVIFHQDKVPFDDRPYAAATKVMSSALELSGSPAKGLPGEAGAGFSLNHTTVEVICVLENKRSDPTDYALERAIKVVSDFQTYYHLQTKTPVRRLTRKLLPPYIPVVRRSSAALDTWEPDIFHVNDGGTNFLAASTPTLSPEQLQS